MSDNVFLKPSEFYQRDVNPIQQYIEQSSFYLSKMTNKSLDDCKDFIKSSLNNNAFQNVKDPKVEYYIRQDNGDRAKAETTLNQYITDTIKDGDILVPTFTTYLPADKKPSMLVEFIDANVKRRSKAKKEAHRAEADGNTDLFIMKNNEQTNMKLYNNSMSGAFATKSSVLHNPTAHSTLTSITRTESSLSNSSNEKLISGNRHYYDFDVTLNNIISITSSIDKEQLQATMTKYQMYYPTVEDVITCIKYSSNLYWKDERSFPKIVEFVSKLDPLERAGFIYISDLHHIRKYNDNLVRVFISNLAKRVTEGFPIENSVDVIKKTDEQIVNFAHQICIAETRGLGKDYEKMKPEDVNTLANTCLNIIKTINTYKDFIDTFFLTKNMPLSAAYIPNMIRRAVVLSDTDSTMFSTDEYVKWYFNDLVFNDEAFGIAASVMFIATQCIAHILAIFSANMNVARDKLFTIAMKPEFAFPVFAQTSVAKHYYTCMLVKEGNVYKEPVMEIKGVHLKNSAMPSSIIDAASSKMKEILLKIMNNQKLSMLEEIKHVANLERKISEALLNGNAEYFAQSKIKNAEAYAKCAEESPYVHYTFWQQIFEPKYGKIEPPPFSVIKIPTILDNITAVKKWIDNIEDKELSQRLATWLGTTKKTSLPTVYLSVQYVKAFGIPKEIKAIINVKKLVMDLTMVNRMILESLGYFPKSGWLLSEQGY